MPLESVLSVIPARRESSASFARRHWVHGVRGDDSLTQISPLRAPTCTSRRAPSTGISVEYG